MATGSVGRWVGGEWVGGSVGKWLVVRWSEVGGFDKTLYKAPTTFTLVNI